jgi:two-component system, NarL family, sensor kinase
MSTMTTQTAGRVAWALAGLAVTVVGLGLVLAAANGKPPSLADESLTLIPLAIGFPLVGALVASHQPRNAAAWIYLGGGLGAGLALFTTGYAQYALVTDPGALPGGRAMAWVSSWVWLTGGTPILTFGLLLFPNGRLPSRRWRLVGWAAASSLVSRILANALMPGPLLNHPVAANPLGIPHAAPVLQLVELIALGVFAVAAACSVASVMVRFRRGTQQERQQLKWLAYAMAVVLLGFALGWVPVTTPLAEVLLLGAITFIPVAMGIAILRYRLFDIDLLINRTLVYTLLTVVLGGTYLGVVAAARLLLQGRAPPGVSVAATALVAVLFAPARSWLQQRTDRLLYGDRHDPHAALSRLGRRLEATMQPEAVLPSLVATGAESLRLPYVAVRVDTGPNTAGSTAEQGRLLGEPLCLPLVHQGAPVGELVLGPRTPGEGFSAADRRVLAELAAQAGVAVHAIRLTAQLQQSRAHLVAAREEERRRLRRDLHDGLGPTLAGVVLGLETAGNLLDGQPPADQTRALLERLRDETQGAIAGIRRLVYGLRPPALDDLGLVPALQTQAATLGQGTDAMMVSVEADGDLTALPAAVEVAAYRIVLEAVTNATRHAHAKHCRVWLRQNGILQIEVRDDGVGLRPGWHVGVGLTSMRERAVELGGTLRVEPAEGRGTVVTASLPVSGG